MNSTTNNNFPVALGSHNNNNNNNKNKNKNNSRTTPFRIVTQNVQGLNDRTKQQQIIDTMDIQNIDIMGLSETKLNKTVSKLIYKKNRNYTSFFNNDSESPVRSGVGLIISKDIAKYISKFEGYLGRVIFVDLFMKGRVKLRIIQVYLPATTTGLHSYTEKLYRYIIKLIEEAANKDYRIVIMEILILITNFSLKNIKEMGQDIGNIRFSKICFTLICSIPLTFTTTSPRLPRILPFNRKIHHLLKQG